jgi:hypothetical protein
MHQTLPEMQVVTYFASLLMKEHLCGLNANMGMYGETKLVFQVLFNFS